MSNIMISIQPKWCEMIANGKKTVEVRKTRPKIKTPFKCYIYCTKSRIPYESFAVNGKPYKCGGKVIGEFICDDIKMSFVGYNEKGCPSYWDILDGSCLTANELVCYGGWKTLYGWHISNLVIYDEPKDISDFRGPDYRHKGFGTWVWKRQPDLQRAPQSWCYVN